ncbi:MAG: hypothetical protein IPP79_24335 [Chitinophagaceae bacterium]|nr:hypothetical protein [Chitinophagaceae bacterium]
MAFLRYPASISNPSYKCVNDVNKNTLRQTDVLILPDGNYRMLSQKCVNE